MDPAAFVPLGRIVKTHGIAGEVSVAVTDGLPLERLIGTRVWFVPPPATFRTGTIASVRPGPKGPLVRFEELSDPNLAAALRGTTMVARPADLPDDYEAEVDDDPVGLRVVDSERGELGEVTDVIFTGANDVWVVNGDRYGEVLLPVIDQVVLEVDWDENVARVRLLPGLIEGE